MQTETLMNNIRQVPDSMLAVFRMVPNLEARPTLYVERNGRGEAYYTLRYFAPGLRRGDGAQKSVYVGTMTDEEAQFLQGWITICWAVSLKRLDRATLLRNIRALRSERQQAMSLAIEAAAACGYYFVGYELRRRRGGRSTGSRDAQADPTAPTRDALDYMRTCVAAVLMVNTPLIVLLQDSLLAPLRQPLAACGRGGQMRISDYVKRHVRSMLLTYRNGVKLRQGLSLIDKHCKARKAA